MTFAIDESTEFGARAARHLRVARPGSGTSPATRGSR